MSQGEVIRVVGGATVYRLFDVGYQIQLEKALDRLASSAPNAQLLELRYSDLLGAVQTLVADTAEVVERAHSGCNT